MNNYKSFNELNDSQKQDIATEFLRGMSVINQNTVVEYILSKSIEGCQDAPFSEDDISNNTPTGQIEINGCYVELDEDGRDEKLEFYERLRDTAENCYNMRAINIENNENDELVNELDNKESKSLLVFNKFDTICDDLENMDFDDYPEIYQWFECDSYLIRLLRDKGECILDNVYWGRTCCGQSIILDGVIQSIAYEFYTDDNKYNNHPDSLDFILATDK